MNELTFQQLVFYGFSGLLILSSLMVISVKNSVKAVLFLVLCFVGSAGLWMLLEAEFLAVTLVLVYVGAVMVLFLFVVMMLDVNFAAIRQGFNKLLPLALLVAVSFLLLISWLVGDANFGVEKFSPPQPKDENYSNVSELGRVLYTDYFYPFELAAILLLVAIIAAISLTFRGKRNRKSQDIDKQVNVSKVDRLRVVHIEPQQPPEKISTGSETSE